MQWSAPDIRNTMAGWLFSAEDIASALSGDRLLSASLDLGNPCNLNCPYCYIEEKDSVRKIRRPGELALEETVAVVEDFAAAGARTINIVGAGEPTIDPHFEEVVSLIAGKGLTPVVFTNGIRLAEDWSMVAFLSRSGATVVLKFNSLDARKQDLIAGRQGYTRKRDVALDKLRDAGLNAHEPTRLALDILAFTGNLEELPKIHSMCRDQNILPIVADYIPTGRTQGGQFLGTASLKGLDEKARQQVMDWLQPLSSAQRAALFRQLRALDEGLGVPRVGASAYYGGAPCTQLLGVYVDVHGRIWPCVARSQLGPGGAIGEPLGDLRSGKMPSLAWRRNRYMAHLRETYNGECPYKPRFEET